VPSKGDASRSSRNVGAGCDGRCGVRCVKACPAKRLQRTAKSCGPGAATVASIRPACAGLATVTTNAAHRGEHEVSRQTLRGESRAVLAVPVVLPVCFGMRDARVLQRAGSTGAVGARLSLRLSYREERRVCKNLGPSCRGIAEPRLIASRDVRKRNAPASYGTGPDQFFVV
jgi:hypothetical protein